MNKKLIIYAGMGLFITAGVAATHPPSSESSCKNCKVIPKNIDDEQMERLMHRMSHDLGSGCTFCHPFTKPGVNPMRVDFVTDELPAKNIARKMMIMTDKINKKYFGFKNDYSLEAMNNKLALNCNTCHRGLPKPNNHFSIPK
jgi:hypothetical protein